MSVGWRGGWYNRPLVRGWVKGISQARRCGWCIKVTQGAAFWRAEQELATEPPAASQKGLKQRLWKRSSPAGIQSCSLFPSCCPGYWGSNIYLPDPGSLLPTPSYELCLLHPRTGLFFFRQHHFPAWFAPFYCKKYVFIIIGLSPSD